MGLLDGKLIALGVTGGISAYRACELARLLVKDGAVVQAVLTEAAADMVGPLTFTALTGRPAEVGEGGELMESGMPHIDLGRGADLILIAPATANTLAKLAHGLADNLLTSTVLASDCPVLLAPAMNTRMWKNPITRRNLKELGKYRRFVVTGPASGSLACGEEGAGRMEEPEVLWQTARGLLARQDLEGRKLLVTAGPTREPVDPVRYLSNRSSGKMGYALAAAARLRGARVILVSGPTGLTPPPGVELVMVETAAQMGRAVERKLKGVQAVLMAAAVADFAPARAPAKKIKKARAPKSIPLKPTPDILASLARKRGLKRIGFAAETGNPVGEARRKLESKKLDLVVANDVSQADAGFDVDTNRVQLVDARGAEELPLLSKDEVAHRILDRLLAMWQGRG